ncbi:peptidase S41 [Bacteroides caecigallinarum]|uniref:S41 family peptidase n=1 Tax=Bacteroides caecigallinarum TaxID=1411144 RepID=UPI00195893A3|nr:S41 family peptidase [Bacteroides caecigallinarum]MBM6865358.1 peptidase S41 [Bacteroides caecigallinarum]
MTKRYVHGILGALVAAALVSSCGEDRSGEYYALITTQTWMYETMQQEYLYYQDMPEENKLDFFKKPSEFLSSVVSQKDKKSGSTFSHIDSVYVTSRAASQTPTFGFEGSMVRASNGSYGIRVLYVQENSPAKEVGLERGSLIIAANNKKINSSDLFYITAPEEAYLFTLGKFNETGFDTLQTVQMPAPRIVENENLYKWNIFEVNGKNVAYILYNEFGDNDTQNLSNMFSQLSGQTINDIVLDLRYNPGGYVNTAQLISTNLAPQEAMGNVFLKMTHNDKINRTDILNFEPGLLSGAASLNYENLYIITSGNTASASEIVINCLKPYMAGRLIQVGTATFGKNVAQQLYTDEVQAPMLEFWLTNSLLSNAEDNSDYYTNGLLPDYEISENLKGELGELGTAQDSLMIPILKHIETGSFPTAETEETLSRNGHEKYNFNSSIDIKPKSAILK